MEGTLCDRHTVFLVPLAGAKQWLPCSGSKEGASAVRQDGGESQVVFQATSDDGVLIPSPLTGQPTILQMLCPLGYPSLSL